MSKISTNKPTSSDLLKTPEAKVFLNANFTKKYE